MDAKGHQISNTTIGTNGNIQYSTGSDVEKHGVQSNGLDSNDNMATAVHHIVLDFTAISFIDTVGCKVLNQVQLTIING